MHAEMDFDLLADRLNVRVIYGPDEAQPPDRQVAAHIWPAYVFQLARPGGPGLFFAAMPETV